VSSTSPEGEIIDASVPVPATFDARPFPIKVVTIPAGDIFRTRLFVPSHIYIFPDESKVPSKRPLNNALLNPIDTFPLSVTVMTSVVTAFDWADNASEYPDPSPMSIREPVLVYTRRIMIPEPPEPLVLVPPPPAAPPPPP
jgi:hypothetical protein